MKSSHVVFLVEGSAAKVDAPDSPRLAFSLLVHASTGKVSGHATIQQTIAPNEILISNVTGKVHKVHPREGGISQLVSLQGTYEEHYPPPLLLIVERKFSAQFATDAQWNGTGGFEYGSASEDGLTVQKTK